MQGTQKTQVQSLGQEDPLEKETATHSSALAWRIPRTEEDGRLQSRGFAKESDTPEGTEHMHTHPHRHTHTHTTQDFYLFLDGL